MFHLQLNFDSISAACRTARLGGVEPPGLFRRKGSPSPAAAAISRLLRAGAGSRCSPKRRADDRNHEVQRTPISKERNSHSHKLTSNQEASGSLPRGYFAEEQQPTGLRPPSLGGLQPEDPARRGHNPSEGGFLEGSLL